MSLPLDLQGDLTLKRAEEGVTAKNDYTEPLTITNSFGVPSTDPEIWQKDLADAVNMREQAKLLSAVFRERKKATEMLTHLFRRFCFGRAACERNRSENFGSEFFLPE